MPVASARHLFVHMPKTGGCWVVRVLRADGPAENVGRPHTPPSVVPAALRRGRVSFGVLREPRSWYESWYLHARTFDRGRRALRAWGRGSMAFGDVLRGVTRPWTVPNLPAHFGGVWAFEDGLGDHRDHLQRSRESLWSWTVGYYGLDDARQVDVLLDFGRLCPDLEALLGHPIDTAALPPENTRAQRSTQLDAEVRWDDERAAWVEEADGARWRALAQRPRPTPP